MLLNNTNFGLATLGYIYIKSGIFTLFNQDSRTSRHDRNLINEDLPYYGCVCHIWELQFEGFTEVVLYCDWHKTNLVGSNATLKKDSETGLYRFKKDSILRSDRQTDEPLVYPSQVKQCIFIDAHVPEGEGVDWIYGIPFIPHSQHIIQSTDSRPVISDEAGSLDAER